MDGCLSIGCWTGGSGGQT